MKKNNQFKNRRAARKSRKYEFKKPNANSYLIIAEGTRTEPYYFRGLKKLIEENVGGRIDVYDKPQIEIFGEGCGTGRLIRAAERIIKNAKVMYQNIWIVLDKDDFFDFDKAIRDGQRKGYHMAWSNESFEYWLYLHFEYSDSALHRKEWMNKLNEIFKSQEIDKRGYLKSFEEIFSIVTNYGCVEKAIERAKRRMSKYLDRQDNPSDYNPGTMVYQLVEELLQYLQE